MVVYNPETHRIGLDSDEEGIAAFGFASGPYINTRFAAAFQAARAARNEADGNKAAFDRARDGDMLWIEVPGPALLEALAGAIGTYDRAATVGKYLDSDPPFDPNHLAYQNAAATRSKIEAAVARLGILSVELYPDHPEMDTESV